MTPHRTLLHRHLHRRRRQDDAGDVPGWVMITVMSAGIVALLTAIAGPELARILEQALASVGG